MRISFEENVKRAASLCESDKLSIAVYIQALLDKEELRKRQNVKIAEIIESLINMITEEK